MVGIGLLPPLQLIHVDLARMYGLLMRIPNGLEPLRRKFEEHVKRSGMTTIQKVLPAPGAVDEAGKAEVLVSWISPSCHYLSLIAYRIQRRILRHF
jgi:hypothetical protein